MRQCKRVNRLLAAYVNGELGVKAVCAVERHLEKCPQCLREYQVEKRIEELLRSEGPALTGECSSPLAWREVHSLFQRETRDTACWRGHLADLWRIIFLPHAERIVSSAVYWGKRVALPATIALAMFIYIAHHHTYIMPRSGQPISEGMKFKCVKISFGPQNSKGLQGWFKDSGETYSSKAALNSKLSYGWRQGSAKTRG